MARTIATTTTADRAGLTAFLRTRHHMILLTPRRDGGRQGSPVTAELLPLPDALEPLVEYLRSVSGDHSDWDEYRAAMTKQGKALIRITPQRWGPVATAGFPTYPAEG